TRAVKPSVPDAQRRRPGEDWLADGSRHPGINSRTSLNATDRRYQVGHDGERRLRKRDGQVQWQIWIQLLLLESPFEIQRHTAANRERLYLRLFHSKVQRQFAVNVVTGEVDLCGTHFRRCRRGNPAPCDLQVERRPEDGASGDHVCGYRPVNGRWLAKSLQQWSDLQFTRVHVRRNPLLHRDQAFLVPPSKWHRNEAAQDLLCSSLQLDVSRRVFLLPPRESCLQVRRAADHLEGRSLREFRSKESVEPDLAQV